ncbi:MAG: succinate--CoA ligase subunit alpha [Deltaproteobacteria bacterium]|nr:succinate--CoA ligase subunit alpha [Deltaproteobacteria bacterium]
MGILVNRDTQVLVQGITGHEGRMHTEKMLEYGTKVVAGVTPGKGGETVEKLHVFNTVKEAVERFNIDASIIFVPAAHATEAIFEACDAGIKLLICITEGIPVHDVMKTRAYLRKKDTILIGPNAPGIIVPDECKIGIMPGYIFKKGPVGVVSRSGTLTYEAVYQLTKEGIGQSTCMGIGGDPVTGMSFVDVLRLFENDRDTKAVLMIGEIGGTKEEEAASFIKTMSKPVFAYIAGISAPPEKKMGHAGAIISSGHGTAMEKIESLKKSGVTVIMNPARVGRTMAEALPLRSDWVAKS